MRSESWLFERGERANDPAPRRRTRASATQRPSDAFVSSVWSFDGPGGNQVYRWYGTLPRQLVERLFRLYARPDTVVIDPFMGLGTTLDVAADAHMRARGTDVNPLACLAASALLFGATEAAPAMADGLCATLTRRNRRNGSRDWSTVLAESRYDYMRKWFRPDTLDSVLALLFGIADAEGEHRSRIGFIAAASVIRDVAAVDPRCTHHLVTKKKPFIDPLPLWTKAVAAVERAVRPVPADPNRVSVAQGSALSTGTVYEPANFAIVHPPYLGVIHYHLIHRLATDLLHIVQRVRAPTSLAHRKRPAIPVWCGAEDGVEGRRACATPSVSRPAPRRARPSGRAA